MSKTEHTPGPWSHDGSWVYLEIQDTPAAMRAVDRDGRPTTPEAEANAKLIAAAPELLAACQEFVRKCECGEARSKRSYAEMKAAIAKAEGE